MNSTQAIVLVCIVAAALMAVLVYKLMRMRHIDRWIVGYLARWPSRRAVRRTPDVHMLLCVADHYEPKHGGVGPEQANERVEAWAREYPRLFGGFRDSDGRPPRHTFFYPIEEYEPEYLDSLADLCRSGFGEVEVHLHHHDDTAENLRRSLLDFKETLSRRHGLLARDPETGEPVFAFIHGNWALDNSHPDGLWCGVNNELDVLREAGCYVDMTMPSAPHATQTSTVNRIYYAVDDPRRPKSHDRGVGVGTAPPPPRSLMMIQGPLLFNWRRRILGVLPRVENACLQGCQPAHIDRVDAWLRARVQVPGRPDWYFVKLHTHGATELNSPSLLGPPMVDFHRGLAERAARDPHFHYHYVTAREMYNLVLAAEAGWTGSVDGARDFRLRWDAGKPAGEPIEMSGGVA